MGGQNRNRNTLQFQSNVFATSIKVEKSNPVRAVQWFVSLQGKLSFNIWTTKVKLISVLIYRLTVVVFHKLGSHVFIYIYELCVLQDSLVE